MAVLIRSHKGCIYRAPIRYVTKTWSVVLLNKKKYVYSYLKCIVYDKLLKPRQSFRITPYLPTFRKRVIILNMKALYGIVTQKILSLVFASFDTSKLLSYTAYCPWCQPSSQPRILYLFSGPQQNVFNNFFISSKLCVFLWENRRWKKPNVCVTSINQHISPPASAVLSIELLSFECAAEKWRNTSSGATGAHRLPATEDIFIFLRSWLSPKCHCSSS